MRNLLSKLPRPSHYAGIEEGIVVKPDSDVTLRIALAFPDTYEVGMSYLGHKILYGIINAEPHWQAERVFAPEKEASALLKEKGLLLASLETGLPLASFNAIGFAVTHELCYTDVLHMLDLAGIPLRHEDRPDDLRQCPLIIGGGGAMAGAEAVAPFFDLVCLGDGEELVPEVLRLLEKALEEGLSRREFLLEATDIPGVYVPSLFHMEPDGTLEPEIPGYRPGRRIVADLEKAAYPSRQVVPIGAVHNRLALEIARGCARGCRFCHAGMMYRPVRERSPQTLMRLLDSTLDNTGFEEISFLSLSTGDFSALKTLWQQAWDRCSAEQITLSLPSLRVGSVDHEIMEKIALLGRTGCTLAPEAGSQRLRDVINKGISEEELVDHARMLLEHGWRNVKLYFMIGLPTETDEDLRAILELCRKTRDAGGKGSPRLAVTASISPFVPKPFTPFQWEAQISLAEMRRRIDFCRDLFHHQKNLTLRWHNPEASHLEGILARPDRRLSRVVEKAHAKGAVFCGWAEHFSLEPWLEALSECGLEPETYIRERDPQERLPWEHLETGVSREFLLRERSRAYAGKTTADCRYGLCGQCGVCDTKAAPSRLPKKDEAALYRHRLVFAKRDQKGDAGERHAPPEMKPEQPRISTAPATTRYHYRIWHEKAGNYAYLSQLELQAAITRSLRRARLPLAFSRGYHAMPLLSFGRALPVGCESKAEWFSISLREYMPPQKMQEVLNMVLPAGMRVWSVQLVEKKTKTAQAIAESFIINARDASRLAEMANAFAAFSALDSLGYEKTGKKNSRMIDLRPFLSNWRIESGPDGDRLAFTLDWSLDYISPCVFVAKVFKFYGSGQLTDEPCGIIKTGQIFEDGRVWPSGAV